MRLTPDGRADPARRTGSGRGFALRAALAYAVLGVVWIALTDLLVEDPAEVWVQTVKGSLFAGASAVFVFVVLRTFVAARRRAEADLRRSEERFRTLVERVPGVVYLNEIDRDDPSLTRCAYVGPQLRDLLGYEPEEWMADDELWQRVIHPDDRDRALEANAAAEGTGELSAEYRAVTRDGRTVWIHDEGHRVDAGAGGPGYWLGVMVDITAQRVADAALHELSESLRGVFAASPLAIMVLEPDGRVRHWNPAAERMLGWAASEVIGPYVPEDRQEEFARLRARVLAGEAFSGIEVTRVRKDGTPIEVSVSTAPFHGRDGRVEAIVGVIEDITERKRIAGQLALQAELLANVNDAVIATDASFRITYWNHGASVLYGWSSAEVVGRDVTELLRADMSAPGYEEIRQSILENGFWRGEVLHPRKDGSRVPVEITTVARTREDGTTYFLSVNRDVTERRRAEEALRRRTRQQEVIARLGATAVSGPPLAAFVDEVLRVVAATLEVDLIALLEPQGDEGGLVLRAGIGWRDGLIGTQVAAPGFPSLAAFTLGADDPVIVSDLRSEWRFAAPPYLEEHGVVSGASVVVRSSGARPYGTLAVLSREPRSFTRDDAHFLESVSALVGFAMDRDRAEAALRAAEARYRQLVETGPGVVYVHDGRQVPAALTYVSPQVVDLLGYPLERWREDPRFWLACIHPGDRNRVLDADAKAIRGGRPLTMEYRLIAADGREVWVQDRAMTIRDEDGALAFRQGLLLDVTERHRAEEERRRAIESQLRLATRLEALHLIDRDVLAAASVEEMADRALDHLRRLVAYDRATVGFVHEETGTYRVLAMRDREGLGPVPDGPLVVDAGARVQLERPVLSIPDLDRFAVPSSLLGVARAMGVRSVLSVALLAEGEHLGNLALTSATPAAFDEEAEDIAREVASQLAIAIRQARLRDALRERAAQLERLAEERRQLLHRIVRAQEEERQRVSLELHDGLGQVLTSISLFAADLEKDVAEHARPRAIRVSELIRRAIQDSRQLVWSLRPPELEHLGLVPAVRRLVEDVSSHGGIEVDLHEDLGDLRLDPEAEAVVYRVVQEALNNVVKHAKATSVSVVIRRANGALSALIEDNGCGFEPIAMGPGQGMGLIGMRERAELVEGTLVVESADGSGARVRLEVPMGHREGSTDG